MNRRSALLLVACLLATGCSDDPTLTGASGGRPTPQTTTAPPAPGPAATAAAGPSFAAEQPPFTADAAPDVQEPRGGPLSVTAVRVANQGSYDRVVFELKGRDGGEPGWQVEYVQDPRRDGSGEAVDVEGEAALAVRISGVGYPMDTGQEEAEVVDGPGATEVVTDVVLGATFEGVYEAWIGTARQTPFRVFRLADPARVVVDVVHP